MKVFGLEITREREPESIGRGRGWSGRLTSQGFKITDDPPFRTDKCPECGSEYFTGGGQVFSIESNGDRSRASATGVVLSCLKCGERLYSTPDGLRRPHEASLPPAWAWEDLQRRAQAAQTAARAAAEDKQREALRTAGPRGPVPRRPPAAPED